MCPGRRGDLDAPSIPDLGRDGLHFRHYSSRVSGRPRNRQSSGFSFSQDNRKAQDVVRLVPDAFDCRDCLDSNGYNQIPPLLADRYLSLLQPLDSFPARPFALPLGRSAGDNPLGSQFSSGFGSSGSARAGSGTAGRGNFRFQHNRSHRRRYRVQHSLHSFDRNTAIPARVDRFIRGCGPFTAIPAALALPDYPASG